MRGFRRSFYRAPVGSRLELELHVALQREHVIALGRWPRIAFRRSGYCQVAVVVDADHVDFLDRPDGVLVNKEIVGGPLRLKRKTPPPERDDSRTQNASTPVMLGSAKT